MMVKSRIERGPPLVGCFFFQFLGWYCVTLQVSAKSVVPTSYIFYERGICLDMIEK